jgi:hypothetical protein
MPAAAVSKSLQKNQNHDIGNHQNVDTIVQSFKSTHVIKVFFCDALMFTNGRQVNFVPRASTKTYTKEADPMIMPFTADAGIVVVPNCCNSYCCSAKVEIFFTLYCEF